MSEPSTAKTPIFTVSNHHTEKCGNPPFYNGDDEGAYIGYFANRFGEQAIFHYDYETKKGTLRMGDAEWKNEYDVVAGKVQGGLTLGNAELLWLYACWEGATGDRIL